MVVPSWVFVIGILLIALIGWFYFRSEIRRRDELAFIVNQLTPLLQDFFAWGPKVVRRGDARVIISSRSSRNICASPYLRFGRATEEDAEEFGAVRTLYINAEVRADSGSGLVVRIEIEAHTVRSSDWTIGYSIIAPAEFVLPKQSVGLSLHNDKALRELVYLSRKYLTRTKASAS